MKYTITILALIFLGACSPSTKQKNLSEFLPAAKATNNVYKLNPQQDTVIHSDAGLVLFIAKNSFVDKNGEPIKEPIQLELNSYKKIAQMLGKGLVTYADKQLLISDGMFELNAKTNSGKEVFINQNSPLKLVAAVDKTMPEVKLFKGEVKDNNVNWVTPENQSNSPIIIPFEILDTSTRGLVECFSLIYCSLWRECEDNFNDFDNCSFDLPLYQNTFVATQDFWERYAYIDIFELDYYIPTFQQNISSLIELYTSMNAWEVDSMILEKITINKAAFPTKGTKSYQNVIEQWIKFKEQKIAQVDSRFFIDLDTISLRNLKEKHIAEYIKTYNGLNNTTTKFELNKFRYQSYQYLSSLSERVTFDITSFGWYNLDRFLNDSSAKPTEIKVVLQADNLLSFNLILKKNRTILSPSNKNGNSFSFSGNLPQVPAYLIAISEEEGQLLLAKKEILIGQNKEEQLELKPVTVEELKQALADIEDGYTNEN